MNSLLAGVGICDRAAPGTTVKLSGMGYRRADR